jgi:hypothetical protein
MPQSIEQSRADLLVKRIGVQLDASYAAYAQPPYPIAAAAMSERSKGVAPWRLRERAATSKVA